METIKAEVDKGTMKSCPTGVQSSSSMVRPAAPHSLLQMHLPISGAPHTRPMQFKLSNHPSSYFHHIHCLLWQRFREQLFQEDLQPKQLNPLPSLDHAASTPDLLPNWLPRFDYTADDQF